MKPELNMEDVKDVLKYISPEEMGKVFQAMKKMFESPKSGKEWKGHVFIPGFSPEMAEYFYYNYEPTKKDVFVTSYPKTGTNWTAEVVRQILFQDAEEDLISKSLPKPFNLLEFFPEEKFAMREKLPLKHHLTLSHLPATLMNMEKIKKANAKVVYVLRNPKDQLVSMYNFMRNLPVGQVEPLKSMLYSGWDKYFEHMIAGDFPSADKPGEWYPEHILSWYKHRDNKSVYFLYYENMKKDLCKEIKLLSDFLGAPVSEEKVQSIAISCSFDVMKKEQTKGNSLDAKILAVNMRKGQVGGWKDHLTVRQSETIDQIFEEKLKETDVKFTYEL